MRSILYKLVVFNLLGCFLAGIPEFIEVNFHGSGSGFYKYSLLFRFNFFQEIMRMRRFDLTEKLKVIIVPFERQTFNEFLEICEGLQEDMDVEVKKIGDFLNICLFTEPDIQFKNIFFKNIARKTLMSDKFDEILPHLKIDYYEDIKVKGLWFELLRGFCYNFEVDITVKNRTAILSSGLEKLESCEVVDYVFDIEGIDIKNGVDKIMKSEYIWVKLVWLFSNMNIWRLKVRGYWYFYEDILDIFQMGLKELILSEFHIIGKERQYPMDFKKFNSMGKLEIRFSDYIINLKKLKEKSSHGLDMIRKIKSWNAQSKKNNVLFPYSLNPVNILWDHPA